MEAMIQPFEVVKYSSARCEYDTKWIIPVIESQTFFFFKTYISIDAYNCFMSHLIPLGEILEWEIGTDYLADQIVQFDNVLYKKIADGGANDIAPFNNPQYSEPNRFDNAFLQTLWTNSLRGLLAEVIMNSTIVNATYQLSSKGAITAIDDNTGMARITKSEMSLLKDTNDSNIYAMVEFMKNYITLNREEIPCLPWRECECGRDENPIRNKTYGARRFSFLTDKY